MRKRPDGYQQIEFRFAGISYKADFGTMEQINVETSKRRALRFTFDFPGEWMSSHTDAMEDIIFGTVRTVISPDCAWMSEVLSHERWHSDLTLSGVTKDKPLCTASIGEIVEVRHVENYALWYDYKITRNKFSLGSVNHHLEPIDLQGGLAKLEEKYGADCEANELFLFHGTSDYVAQIISTQGFDPRISRSEGHYGMGTYFARQACKALRYAKQEPDGLYTLIVARVVLGEPYYATRFLQREFVRRPPSKKVDLPPGPPRSPMRSRSITSSPSGSPS